MSDNLKVAVVGAGPAGLYAAEALVGAGASVDVIERLPAPYGLVRYGVAPDHLKMKATIRVFERVLSTPGVRFVGNVDLGVDLTLDELRARYDAVLLASGSAKDRRLGIPGEDLPGSVSATDFVNWYNGHPDTEVDRFVLEAREVVVIGVGNVALDVVRLMAKSQADVDYTDVPQHVHDVFAASHVTDLHLVGRRGAAYAKFTTKELRELGEIEGVDVVVDPADLAVDEAAQAELDGNRVAARNLVVMQEWAEREPTGAPRRIHLRFNLAPKEVLGDDAVRAMTFERTAPDGRGGVAGTGEVVEVAAQMVLRSVGYRGTPTDGAPFDAGNGTIPHERGRVVRDGVQDLGLYVAGWIKRGPTGIIGTNKSDAHETTDALLEDAAALVAARPSEWSNDLVADLVARGVDVVTWDHWSAIDAAEIALGATAGRERTKLHDRTGLLGARGVAPRP